MHSLLNTSGYDTLPTYVMGTDSHIGEAVSERSRASVKPLHRQNPRQQSLTKPPAPLDENPPQENDPPGNPSSTPAKLPFCQYCRRRIKPGAVCPVCNPSVNGGAANGHNHRQARCRRDEMKPAHSTEPQPTAGCRHHGRRRVQK
jgi:hypothetical protein